MVIGYISYLGYSTSLPPPIFNGLYFSLALKYPRSTVQTGVWFTQLTKASLSILAQQYYWYEAFVTCNLAVSWNHFTELLLPCALYWYGIGTTKQGSWRKAYLSPFSLSLSETSLDPARSNKISALSLQRGIYSCLPLRSPAHRSFLWWFDVCCFCWCCCCCAWTLRQKGEVIHAYKEF